MSDWSKLKEFEIVFEEYDYFFAKQFVRRYYFLKAFDLNNAKQLASFVLGNVDIISIEEFI